MSTVPFMLLENDIERGGKSDDGIENEFAYRNNVLNATQEIRLGFVRKVYSLLSLQLLTTLLIGTVFITVEPVKLFIHQNDWMVMMAFVFNFIILIALMIKRRDHPTNLILLAAFTIIQAFTVGVLVTFFDKLVVLQAVFLTFAVVMGVTLFTFNTKKDFSSLHSGLFAALCVILVGGFMQLFIQSSGLELILSIGGALLFSLFIIFDTQQLMSNLSPEEYILATINLYLDIINLFLNILRILQQLNK